MPYLPHYRREFIELLAAKLRMNGFELELLCGQNRMKKEIRCAEVSGCKMMLTESVHYHVAGAHIGYQKGLVRKLRSAAPDAVICLFNPGHVGHVIALSYCLKNKIPFLLWGCAYERIDTGRFIRIIRQAVRRFFLRRAAGHICYGNELKKELLSKKIPASRIWVAQNTVNVGRIAQESSGTDKLAAREQCGIPEDSLMLLFVGAMVPQKNLKALIHAFLPAAKEHPNLVLYIVGEGAERTSLEALCNELGVSGKIVFTGAKYDVELKNYFVSADVFVMPGTGGLAVNEAMAYGLPVIAARGDGTVTDLIEHKKTGYILENQCPAEAVLEALNWFIAASARGEMNQREVIRKQVLAKASLENMVSNFFEAVSTTLFRTTENITGRQS